MAQIIKTSGEIIYVTPKNGKNWELSELKEIVHGYIEVCDTHDGGRLVIDEEGKLKGYDYNEVATNLYKYSICGRDYIVGDVLYIPESEKKTLE